jgi:uncharacterized membrane protein YidH (DUF202 family)
MDSIEYLSSGTVQTIATTTATTTDLVMNRSELAQGFSVWVVLGIGMVFVGVLIYLFSKK